MEGDIITMSELFRFERSGLDKEGKVMGQIKATGVVPVFCKRLAGARHRSASLGVPHMTVGTLIFIGLIFGAVFLLAQALIVPARRERAHSPRHARETPTHSVRP